MEQQTPEVTRSIQLEQKHVARFDEKLADLRLAERSRERESLNETQQIKDGYKMKWIQRLHAEGVVTGETTEMPIDLMKQMAEEIAVVDRKYEVNGVYFAKCQFSKIIDALREGKRVEFEGWGPYLRDYIFQGIDHDEVELTKGDEIGLALMEFLRKDVIPEAHPIALYDTLNMWMSASDTTGRPLDRDAKKGERGKLMLESNKIEDSFRMFVERQLRSRGIIQEDEQGGAEKDFVLVSERDKQKDAEELARVLEEKGLLRKGEGDELWFQNTIENADDPRYLRINLRSKDGDWQCAALDASAFLNPRNREIVHLVMLPKENFEQQQDHVWEMLHALGFKLENYHNIFFDASDKSSVTPESAVSSLKQQLGSVLGPGSGKKQSHTVH